MMRIDISRNLHGADGNIYLRIDMALEAGELVTLHGPSGAGKTSILRMVAGLMKPDAGVITVNGQTWFDHHAGISVAPQHRRTGMVFQEYTLFPNMTVRENLSFALAKGQPATVIDELLETIGLKNLEHKKPALLSGGQKQRIALARALVRTPTVLLLDEPLAALDTAMRSRLQDYVLQMHRQRGLITIMVSHDLPEIIKMSSRTWVLENGSIRDVDPRSLLPS